MKFWDVVLIGFVAALLLGAGYREYLIHNGRLTSDLDAGGHSITNLPSGFFPTNGFASASDVYTKAETDGRIVELSPAPGDYANVSNRAVNALQTNLESFAVGAASYAANTAAVAVGSLAKAMGEFSTAVGRWAIAGADDAYALGNWAWAYGLGSLALGISAQTGYGATNAVQIGEGVNNEQNTLQFRGYRLLDAKGNIPEARVRSAVTDIVGGMSVTAQEEDPVWELEKAEYAKSNAVAAVNASLSALWTYTLGESVWFAVTNYMRTAQGVIPSLQLWEVRDGLTNLVYHSTEEITNTVHNLFGGLAAQFTNALPSRAWGAYQSGTGADNPDPANTTVVTTPQVMLTGGGEWNRYVSTGGSSVWVLHSSGMTSFGGGADGSFLKIEDDEGNAAFEVSRTDSYEVDAVPSSCRFDDATGDFTVTYDYSGGSPPVLYASTNLLAGSFIGEDEDHEIDAYGLAVSWAQTATNWTATVSQDAAHPRLFIHAKATMPGSVAIKQNAPVQFGEGGGILYNNKRYVPTVSGTELKFVEAP